ncbi:hypothetical protein WCLP8_3840011 [uncultured Gammaproteobacteria bacterium]
MIGSDDTSDNDEHIANPRHPGSNGVRGAMRSNRVTEEGQWAELLEIADWNRPATRKTDAPQPCPPQRPESDRGPSGTTAGFDVFDTSLFDDWARLEGAGTRPIPESALVTAERIETEANAGDENPTPSNSSADQQRSALIEVRTMLERELEGLRTEELEARQELDKTNQKLHATRLEIEHLERQGGALVESQAVQAETRIVLEHDLIALQADLSHLRMELDTANQEFGAKREAIEILERERRTLARDSEAAQTRLTHDQDQLARLAQDIAATESRQSELARDLDTLAQAGQTAQRQSQEHLAAADLELQSKRAEINQLSQHGCALAADVAAIKSSLTRDQEQLARLAQDIATKQSRQSELARDLDRLAQAGQTAQRQSQEQLAATGLELQSKRAEINQLNQHGCALAADVAAIKSSLTRDQNASNQLAKQRTTLESEVEVLQAEQNRYRKEITALSEASRIKRTEVDALELQTHGLTDEVAVARTQLGQATAAAQTMQRHRDVAAEDIRGLNRQREAIKSELTQLQEEKNRLQEDFHARRLELITVYNHDRKLLDKLKRELAATQHQHAGLEPASPSQADT